MATRTAVATEKEVGRGWVVTIRVSALGRQGCVPILSLSIRRAHVLFHGFRLGDSAGNPAGNWRSSFTTLPRKCQKPSSRHFAKINTVGIPHTYTVYDLQPGSKQRVNIVIHIIKWTDRLCKKGLWRVNEPAMYVADEEHSGQAELSAPKASENHGKCSN